MDTQETKKYIQMENILNKINQMFISLPPSEVKRNNKILEQVIDPLTDKIKEKSVLFKNMYERKFYGGSFYDGIKVGKPEEYDLDYVINLPLLIEPQVEVSDKPGFVHVRIKEYMKLVKQKVTGRYDKLDTLIVDDYLSTNKVLQWMEKSINLALNEFPKTLDGYRFNVVFSEQETVQFYATVSKSHPAFTLKLKNTDGTIYLDIDLVPCFQFGVEQWPTGQYRNNSTERNKFLVVPKKPHSVENGENIEKYWRLSFQEQERVLITGSSLKALKPSIKLLKKLRDKHNHKIASYFIKTVFLWEVHNIENKDLWGQPLSYVFMTMLKRYTELIKNKCIRYYWNENFNLIGHIKAVTLIDIGNTLKRIIDQVDQRLEEPFTITKYLVLPDAIEELRGEVQLGKKFLKKQRASFDTSSKSLDNSDVSNASIEEIEENQPVVLTEASPNGMFLDALGKLDRKAGNIEHLCLARYGTSSKSLDNSDVSNASIEEIEENQPVVLTEASPDVNGMFLDALGKLDRKAGNIEHLCLARYGTSSKSLDNSDVSNASILEIEENQSVVLTEASTDVNGMFLDALGKLDRKAGNIEHLCLARYDTSSKSLDNSDVSNASILEIEENQPVVLTEASTDVNDMFLDALGKLVRKAGNMEQLCLASYDTSSKSLDNSDVRSVPIKKIEVNQPVVITEASPDVNGKLLDALEKLDRKTDKIYDVVTKLATMNNNLLKICSDLTERMDDLEDSIDGLKLTRKSKKNSDRIQTIW